MEFDLRLCKIKFKPGDKITLTQEGKYEATLEARKWYGELKAARCAECSFAVLEKYCLLSNFCQDIYFEVIRNKYT